MQPNLLPRLPIKMESVARHAPYLFDGSSWKPDDDPLMRLIRWRTDEGKEISGVLSPSQWFNEQWSEFDINGIPASEVRCWVPRVDEDLASDDAHIELTESLLTEAIACRSGVIPEKAFVECHVRPFVGVHLFERRDQVMVAWEHREGERFCLFRLDVSGVRPAWSVPLAFPMDYGPWLVDHFGWDAARDNTFMIPVITMKACGVKIEHVEALRFLTAAIVRDFWVIENRESSNLLGPPRLTRKPQLPDGRNRIVYLPRLKYCKRLIERAADRSNDAIRWKVSPHFVRSHVRRLPSGQNATIRQRAVAQFHGVDVEPGTTWVKGHVAASKNECEITYRSRSATRALMSIIDFGRQGRTFDGLSGFEFERLCEVWLQRRGYKIVTKVGDRGIDILSIDCAGQYSLVQCKCWTRTVTPSVVRELVGASMRYEAELGVRRLKIMASGGFSIGARREAEKVGVELIEIRAA